MLLEPDPYAPVHISTSIYNLLTGAGKLRLQITSSKFSAAFTYIRSQSDHLHALAY